MKKTCDGCKALMNKPCGRTSDYRGAYQCGLNYRMDPIKRIPLEQCPKPTTHKDVKAITHPFL